MIKMNMTPITTKLVNAYYIPIHGDIIRMPLLAKPFEGRADTEKMATN